jgi:uncharacterized MAPEG superfamily protein
VVFAPPGITVHLAQAGDGLTAGAGTVFVLSRIAHAIIYTLGIPLWRTMAFIVGFARQMICLFRLLAWI